MFAAYGGEPAIKVEKEDEEEVKERNGQD